MRVKSNPAVTLVGHRGASALAPENTLPAFEAALAAGVTMIETDVRLTRDHRLICFHDDRLDRLTPEQGPVSERDWSELRDLPVLRGSFGGKFPNARIPLLEDILRAIPSSCSLCVEIKAHPSRPGEVARGALECLREAGALERTRIIAFDVEDLRAVRRLAAPVDIGILAGRAQLPYWEQWARELNATAIHFEYRQLLAQPALIEAAHQLGYTVNAWTVSDAETAATLAALGIDELTTDDPIALHGVRAPNTPNT